MRVQREVFGRNFRVSLIVIVLVVTLFSVAIKGDEVAVAEGVELTVGERFEPLSPVGILLTSGGVVFVGWLRRRKMRESMD